MKTWPDPCRCTPGTEINGWHEQRCDMCIRVEKNIWARAMQNTRLLIERYRP